MKTPLTFLWPELLWLLWAIPLQLLAYAWLLQRRKALPLRFSSVALVRQALGSTPPWRRHVPPALFLLAMALVLLATARPQAALPLPTHQATVMLAVDVSLSMRVDDVLPSRLVAAQQAAKAFVRQLPTDVRVGLVSFAGTAQVVHAPTRSREDALAAIDRLQLQPGTAIGNGIAVALSELFPQDGIDVGELTFGPTRPAHRPRNAPLDDVGDAPRKALHAVEPGSDRSAAIVLLTDGRSTTGLDPQKAAALAAERGVRIHTVGLGRTGLDADEVDTWSFLLQLDEDTLKTVARTTRGDYFQASTLEGLLSTYEQLGARLQVETRPTELSSALTLGALLLFCAAAGLSLLWSRRVV